MLVCTVEEFRVGLNETSEEAARPQRRIKAAKDPKTGNTIITEAQANARIHWVNTRGGKRGRQERALARLMADPHPCTQTMFDIRRLQVKLGYPEVEG